MKTDLPAKPERDVRIDLFRGLVLLIVLIDHIEELNNVSLISRFTPDAFGFSDSSEAFVFLSGYTFGLVYDRRIAMDGFWASFKRVCRRSCQIYVSYLITLSAILLIGFFFRNQVPNLEVFLSFQQSVSEHLLGALLISNQPYGFPILGFFVVMLPLAVFFTWLSRVNWLVACYLSASVYVFAQFDPQTNFRAVVPDRNWFFNPFAWQFLYFIGITTARCEIPAKLKRWTTAAMLVLTCILLPMGIVFDQFHQLWAEYVTGAVGEYVTNSQSSFGKNSLAPVRLMHFLCVAWVLSKIVSPNIATWRRLKPICTLGRNSLFLYNLGLVLLYISLVLFASSGKSHWDVLAMHVGMLSVAIAITLVKDSRRLSQRAKATHTET